MYYIVPTPKSVADAARDLEAAVMKHEFGVLHVHDLKETLTRKGYPLKSQCRVFEVCNPREATRVLERDMRLNMALPCRISVFEDQGGTKIGTILPTEMLGQLSSDSSLGDVAKSVESTIKAIIDDAAGPRDTREVLLRRREALAREIEAGTAKGGAPRDGNVPDSAEISSAHVARAVVVAEVERDVAELEAIDAALARLDAGRYGRCVDCATAIEPARLAHVPETARCTRCQRRREQESGARIARL